MVKLAEKNRNTACSRDDLCTRKLYFLRQMVLLHHDLSRINAFIMHTNAIWQFNMIALNIEVTWTWRSHVRVSSLRKLQRTVNDRAQLRHMTGEWFYETKQRRHQERIHGSDIIRASMRQAYKPMTIREFARASRLLHVMFSVFVFFYTTQDGVKWGVFSARLQSSSRDVSEKTFLALVL